MNTQLIISIVTVIIVVVAFFIWLAWQIKKNGLRRFTIEMITRAEEVFEKGRNSDKMQYVIGSIKTALGMTKLGKILSIFVTDENIEKFIQNVFDEVKKALDYTPNN